MSDAPIKSSERTGLMFSLVPRLISSFRAREEELGNVGRFKPLTSGGSARAPPIRLQSEIT